MEEKLGFTCEGIRRGYSHGENGEYHSSAMYGLVWSDYAS
jgi:RimJ/RimL family protein N-acetyltransferase